MHRTVPVPSDLDEHKAQSNELVGQYVRIIKIYKSKQKVMSKKIP